MTDLDERIASLPAYPPDFTGDLGAANAIWWRETLREQRDAALTRLELLREWIEDNGCSAHCASRNEWHCTCGIDAILAATEVPK